MRRVMIVAIAAFLLPACSGDSGDTSVLEAELQAAQEKIADLETELFTATSSTEAASTATGPAAAMTTSTTSTAIAETTTTVDRGPQPLSPQASPFVAGTFFGDLPPGMGSEISVILEGTNITQAVPLIVRNMTEDAVVNVEVAGLARDQDGVLLASGSSQGFSPNLVAPGEIAFGYVYFGFDADLSRAATTEWTVSATPSTSEFLIGTVDLVPTEWSSAGSSIIVLLSNDTAEVVEGPIGANAACFDSSGEFTDVARDFADGDTVDPQSSVGAQISPYQFACDTYLLAGSGYDF